MTPWQMFVGRLWRETWRVVAAMAVITCAAIALHLWLSHLAALAAVTP